MKAAVYYGPKNILIEEVPTPKIRQLDVLVEMRACGLCGSDLMEWYIKTRAPLVPGHEPSGVVAKVGRKVEGYEVGDRVFAHHCEMARARPLLMNALISSSSFCFSSFSSLYSRIKK